ncbi:hypothetical protein ACH4UV_39320 [Streptomyces sp. NPDC020802]|uniref:hypothetical protein n=1 Tax=Streptomyces sp. NPDC020802 TaxID=3365094 RepID=UPI00379B528E
MARRTQDELARRKSKMAPFGPVGFGVVTAIFAYVGVSVVIAAKVSDVLFWLGIIFLAVAVVALIMCAEEIQARRADTQSTVIARQHTGKYVCPCDLEQEDRTPLLRAAKAVDSILASTAHEMGIVDKVRNGAELHEMLWKIAKDAEKINRLAMKHWGASAISAGAAVDSVLSSQLSALEISRQHATTRVAALEEYARQVKEIDSLLTQQKQLELLDSTNDEYLDLVAQASGDDTATQRVKSAGEEAVVAADPLAEAVQRARDAAELALPDKA